MSQTDHSFSKKTQITCSRCNKNFDTDVWLIIDATEQCQVLTLVQNNMLQKTPCPFCRTINQFDAPLLIYRKNTKPNLIFSPNSDSDFEKHKNHIWALINQLRNDLDNEWQDS
jgi:hypothetical protein